LQYGWLGQSAADLEQVWGQPSEETVTAAGRTITYLSYWSGSFAHTQTCRRTFTMDLMDIIIDYRASGCST
jgi:hypothetical protein